MRNSLAKLLPFLTLALCSVTLIALATPTWVDLAHKPVHNGFIDIYEGTDTFRLPRTAIPRWAIFGAANQLSRPIQALNFPAMTTEMVMSGIMRSWPDSWRPAVFGPLPADLFLWRAIIFPVYCLPFWWIAGVGLDALLGSRQLRRHGLLGGSLLCGFFVFIGTGLAIAGDHRDYRDMWFIFAGLAIWSILLAAYPAVWLRERRRRKSVPNVLP